MAYKVALYVFQGLRLEVNDTTYERDLKLFIKLYPDRFYEFLNNSPVYLYHFTQDKELSNGYYLYSSKVNKDQCYLYFGIYLSKQEVGTIENESSVEHEFPSDIEIGAFKNYCTELNLDTKSFGFYSFTRKIY